MPILDGMKFIIIQCYLKFRITMFSSSSSSNMVNMNRTIWLTCGTPTKYLTSVLYTPVAEPSCANCTRLHTKMENDYKFIVMKICRPINERRRTYPFAASIAMRIYHECFHQH